MTGRDEGTDRGGAAAVSFLCFVGHIQLERSLVMFWGFFFGTIGPFPSFGVGPGD